MKARIESKLDARIAEEIYRAAEDLGADPVEMRTVPLARIYNVLEQLGGHPDLLAIVGTWGDGGPWTEDDDAATLAQLRDWNAETQRLASQRQRAATAH